MNRKCIISVVLCVLLSSCISAHVDPFADPDSLPNPKYWFGKPNHDAIGVSVINLVATPEQYHGKVVRVIGVIRIEFEGNALFLSRDDYNHRVSKNALWLNLDYPTLGANESAVRKLNGQYVLVEGVFDKNMHGHMGLNSGAIQNVHRIIQWRN